MKKILALILAACCVLALVSCVGGATDEETTMRVNEIKEMFATGVPTKIVTTTVHTVGSTILTSNATLVTGILNSKTVSVYINDIEELAQVSNSLDPISRKTETLWYMQGKGTSKDKGVTWDSEGVDFAPAAGSIKINLDVNKATTVKYDEATETLVMTFDAANANSVVDSYLAEGQKIESDLTVTVGTSGGSVTMIKLEYKIPEHTIDVEGATNEDGSAVTVTIQETTVVITAVYEYDIQDVTLE